MKFIVRYERTRYYEVEVEATDLDAAIVEANVLIHVGAAWIDGGGDK